MDLSAEIAQLNLSPALRESLLSALNQSKMAAEKSALLEQQLHQASNQLKHAELKIQALAMELAHHKRIKFGVKSEAFSAVQRELFADDWSADNAEIELAVEALQTPPRAPRQNAGRQTLPDTLPRVIHRHEPTSCECGQCGRKLTLIREEYSE